LSNEFLEQPQEVAKGQKQLTIPIRQQPKRG